MQGTKMNANSRRILQRKLRTSSEAAADGTVNNGDGGATGQIVNGQVTRSDRTQLNAAERMAAMKKPAKKIPTQSLDLSFSSNRNQSADAVVSSSFAPKLNKKSIQIATAMREGKIEDPVIKQGELQKKKKADI